MAAVSTLLIELDQEAKTSGEFMKKKGGSNRVVIVIEDDESIRKIFQVYLEELFILHVASSGLEGIKLISSQKLIHLLITDFDLKNSLDGLDMLREAKKKHPNALLILCTGSPSEETRMREALAIPGILRLNKPFQIEDLDKLLLLIK